MLSCWNLITPIGDGPDESANIIRAVAVDHGQLIGTRTTLNWFGAKVYTVKVPWFYAMTEYSLECQVIKQKSYCSSSELALSHCNFRPFFDLTSNKQNCTLKNVNNFSNTAIGFTYIADYPPYYYFVVGLASLAVSPGYNAAYLMREISILFSSGILASLFFTIYQLKRRRWTFLGLLIGMTPMIIYMQGIVNGLGLEGLSGLCFVFYSTLLLMNSNNYSSRILNRLCFVGLILVSIRPTGVVWLVVDLIPVVLLTHKNSIKKLCLDRKVKSVIAIISIATLLNLAWQLIAGEDSIRNNRTATSSFINRLFLALINQFRPIDLAETVGWFNNVYQNVKSPIIIVVVWLFCWWVIVLLAFIKGNKKLRKVLLLYILGYYFISLFLDADLISSFGAHFWQGSFGFGGMSGIPVVAALIIDVKTKKINRLNQILTTTLPFLLWAFLFTDFIVVFKWDLNKWSPIVPPGLLMVMEAVSLILILVVMKPAKLRTNIIVAEQAELTYTT